MQENLFTDFWFKVFRFLGRRLRWIGSFIIPKADTEPYRFEKAKEYWHNVPRAQGVNPFDTLKLEHMPIEALVSEFENEAEIARQKKERKIGFDLAFDSISSSDTPIIMDYGSGIGFYGFEIMDRHPGARVTFVDINEANLAIIEQIAAYKGISDRVSIAVVHDECARNLKFNQNFDLIMSMGVLHHTPHAPEIVNHLSQFQEENSIFQVMLYNFAYLRNIEKMAGRRLNESGFGAGTDPAVDQLCNPYSEAYDNAKAKRLFHGYELISAHYPTPFYNTYQFKKVSV